MIDEKGLLVGGILSCIAAAVHIGIIVGGPSWYRFFGAGERMASMAEGGSLYPTLVTLGIAGVLFVWGLYAFSGAGLLPPLPLLKPALLLISGVYLIRGLAFVPAMWLMTGTVSWFAIWSSLICLGFGVSYAVGTWSVWQNK